MAANHPDTWLYQPRGGYGYVLSVPCRVLSETQARLKIAVLRKDGSEIVRFVKPCSVRRGN